MTRPAVGGCIAQAHALNGAGFVRGKLLTTDAHEELGSAQRLGHAFGAFGHGITKALPVGGLLGHGDEGFRAAELQRNLGFVLADHTLLEQLHGRGYAGPKADGIHTQVVTQPVGLDQRVQVAHATLRAHGPGRFVLGALAGDLPVLRIGGDRVFRGGFARQGADPPTGNGAGETGFIGDQAGFGQGFTADVFGFIKDGLLMVAGR